MEASKRIVLGSALAAGMLTSALIAGVAIAAPGPSTPVKSPAAVATETDNVDHQASGEEVGDNGNGIADANEAAETATEADGTEAKATETDGVDHQFDGEEVGDNGNGVPDANEAAETK